MKLMLLAGLFLHAHVAGLTRMHAIQINVKNRQLSRRVATASGPRAANGTGMA